MSQPLVTRPAYGHGGSSMPTAESGLPGGGPSDRGLPLDPSIPGSKTYSKPEGDVRQPKKDDESIYRVDNPDDLTKDRSRIDTVEDNADKHDGIGGLGKGEWDTTNKTKYPYRDKRPNQHYAALDPEMVVQLWHLRNAHELVLPASANVKVAVKISEIMRGVNKRTLWKSGLCRVAVKRKDPGNLRWIFAVNCGNGPKLVNLKAERSKNMTRMARMEIRVRCSCPGWRWLGPEFHAKGSGYQDGKPRGTASTPDIKDPERHNRVCKHVAAVMREIKEWVVPTTPKKK